MLHESEEVMGIGEQHLVTCILMQEKLQTFGPEHIPNFVC